MDEDEEPAEQAEEDPPPPKEERKHVTMKDEPEIFTIRPDTLEVEKQERPKPLEPSLDTSTEELTPEELAHLIQETANIIQICEEKVLNQKLNSAKLGFMLIRIAESIEEYEIYMNHLNRFLVNGDEVTAKYFIDVCEGLPPYGDYLSTLCNVADSSVKLGGLDGPVEKTDLQHIVKDIQKNAYSGGMSLGSLRVMNKAINNYMRERRQVTEQFSRQIRPWLNLKNAVTEHLDELRERLYKLSAYLDFAKSGETRIKPAPDISASSFEDSSFRPIFHSTPVSFENSGVRPMLEESNMSASEDRKITSGNSSSPVFGERMSPGNSSYMSGNGFGSAE